MSMQRSRHNLEYRLGSQPRSGVRCLALGNDKVHIICTPFGTENCATGGRPEAYASSLSRTRRIGKWHISVEFVVPWIPLMSDLVWLSRRDSRTKLEEWPKNLGVPLALGGLQIRADLLSIFPSLYFYIETSKYNEMKINIVERI
jgi:hypothetical protein